ncbi:hypothetical protein OAK83_00365 [bacterium]|nr:hypothetical protein [bacterium]
MHGHHLRKIDQMPPVSPWWTPRRSEYAKAWPDTKRPVKIQLMTTLVALGREVTVFYRR